MYAERISDLFSPVIGAGDSKIRYSDLFTVSEKFSKEIGKSISSFGWDPESRWTIFPDEL